MSQSGIAYTFSNSSTTFAGSVCGLCAKPYGGVHECAIEDLLERAEYLQELARKRFDQLCPPPAKVPEPGEVFIRAIKKSQKKRGREGLA